MTVYNVSYDTHKSRSVYDIMRNMCKLVLCNHANLVCINNLVPMYYVHKTRRDCHHDMKSRSPIRMLHRNRS